MPVDLYICRCVYRPIYRASVYTHLRACRCIRLWWCHTHLCVCRASDPTRLRGSAPLSRSMSWSRLLVQWGTKQNVILFVFSPQPMGDCSWCCHSMSPCQLSLKNHSKDHTHKKKKRNWCIQSSMYLYKWCNGNKMYEINNLESFCWVCHSHARMHTHMQTHTLHMQTYTHKHTHTHTHKHLSSTHTHTHQHTPD